MACQFSVFSVQCVNGARFAQEIPGESDGRPKGKVAVTDTERANKRKQASTPETQPFCAEELQKQPTDGALRATDFGRDFLLS